MADHGNPFRTVGELDTLLDFLDYLRDCLRGLDNPVSAGR